jgi:hypothetical protein
VSALESCLSTSDLRASTRWSQKLPVSLVESKVFRRCSLRPANLFYVSRANHSMLGKHFAPRDNGVGRSWSIGG